MPVTQLLIDQVGWRTTWTILAVIFITLTIPAAALFLRRSPEDMGLTMDGDPVGLATASTSAEQQGGPEATWTVREALCTSALWKLMLVFSLGGVAMGGTMVHRIPTGSRSGGSTLSWSPSLSQPTRRRPRLWDWSPGSCWTACRCVS